MKPTINDRHNPSGINLCLAPAPPRHKPSQLRSSWSAGSSENKRPSTPIDSPDFYVDTDGAQLQPCHIVHRPWAQSARALPCVGIHRRQQRTQSATLPRRLVVSAGHHSGESRSVYKARRRGTPENVIEIECGGEEFEERDDRVVRERAVVPRLKYHHARDRRWPTTCPPSSHDSDAHRDTASSDVRNVKNSEDQNRIVNVEDVFCAPSDQLEDGGRISLENGDPAEWAYDKRDNYNNSNVNDSEHDATYGNNDVSGRSHDITDGSHNGTHGHHDVIDGLHDTTGRSHNDDVTDGSHHDTNRSYDATNRSRDVTDRSRDVTDRSNDDTHVCHDVTDISHDTTNGSHDDTNIIHDYKHVCHDVTDISHDTTNGSHYNTNISYDATNRSNDYTHVCHDVTDISHDSTNGSHDDTNRSHDDTSRSHDIAGRSHATNLDTDGHIMKFSSVPDNICVKEGECNPGASTEHILQPSTCTNKLPTSKHTTNVIRPHQGNIPSETDISKRRNVSISEATSSEGHIHTAVKTLRHVAAIQGIPSEVITTHCSNVDDTIALCHKEKRDASLDDQVEVDNCFDTNGGRMESVTGVVWCGVVWCGVVSPPLQETRENTLDPVAPTERYTLVPELISGSDGVYKQEASHDVDSSEPSCGGDESMIQRTLQSEASQDSSSCETMQDKPQAAIHCRTQHGVSIDDAVNVVNHGGRLSDLNPVTSDTGSHITHGLREHPVLLERKGTTRTPDGASMRSDKHRSNSSGRHSVVTDVSYLLSTPDIIDISPSSGEDMSSPNFVASVRKQLLQMKVCQNLSAGADASDVYASPVNYDQPRIQTRSTSESRDATSAAKPRHVTLRGKKNKLSEEGRGRRSLTAQGNRGVRPEHDTFKIQNIWMRRDMTDAPRSARTCRNSLYSTIPVIVLTSDVNEVTYLSVIRRMSHDAYC